ncbi:MAG: starch-binding protein, partial [Lachnospiraceae bacterium]|nr:starch-binding protein [Lachnospiraceae bacterium]
MYRLKKKLLAGILTFVMTVTALAGSEPAAWGNTDSMVTAYAAEDYGLADNTNDGVILHAWCWSFNTIKNNMKLIAQAGYTSVQTSPINECVVGDNGALTFGGHWYYHYQPTNYTIGNYQLGTEAEFIAMCNEADKYGIKIIVDVVANHMTSDWSKINSNWQNSSYFHGNTGISNWSDRYDVTQNALLGLWDLNTQSSVVQQRILSYLRQCVADGADGFRFDAAKHIELPDDQGYGGSFWPTILNNGSAFQYGEILQDSISRDSAYAQYMNVTASSYGYVVREQLAANDLSSSRLSAYYADGVNPDNLVTWVESHDNYCDGVSTYMSNNDLRFAWAILASRRYGTPLFFSRPKGGGNGVMFPEQSRLGDMGDAFFYDNTIVAVNRFHNEMIDQSESMKNYNGTSTLIIERGNKGMVIVNKGAGQNLYTQTSLANGTYKDQISGSTFTVSNGNISGYINANSVYVIYNPINSYEEPETQPAPEGSLIVHFKRTDWGNGTPYIYAYTDGGTTITAGWPGTLMSADASQGSGWYTYANAGYTSANVMFNMGVGSPDRDPGDGQPGYPVSGEVWYYQGSIYTYN